MCSSTMIVYQLVVSFLCMTVLFLIIIDLSQSYLNEYGFNSSQPLTIDTIKQAITMVLENKICSKFKKTLPFAPPSNDFYSIQVVYSILSCSICALLGYIFGAWTGKKSVCSIEVQKYSSESYSTDNAESSTCSLCLNIFKPGIVLLPCKHVCICTNCWVRFYQESRLSCPICRENIEEVMNVFCS